MKYLITVSEGHPVDAPLVLERVQVSGTSLLCF